MTLLTYTVETVNENFDVYHELILVTQDKDLAYRTARIEADDAYMGTVLKEWKEGKEVNRLGLNSRLDCTVVASQVPSDSYYHYGENTSHIIDQIRKYHLSDRIVTTGRAAEEIKEVIEDYIQEVTVEILTEKEYTELISSNEPHYVIVDYFDEKLLPNDED